MAETLGPETLHRFADYTTEMLGEGSKTLHSLARAWQKERNELGGILLVAVARGEKLGYMDDDYRARLIALGLSAPEP